MWCFTKTHFKFRIKYGCCFSQRTIVYKVERLNTKQHVYTSVLWEDFSLILCASVWNTKFKRPCFGSAFHLHLGGRSRIVGLGNNVIFTVGRFMFAGFEKIKETLQYKLVFLILLTPIVSTIYHKWKDSFSDFLN